MEKKVIVQNLKCGGCANTITKKLSELEGIETISVDKDIAEVTMNGTEQALTRAEERLSELGYPVEGESNSILQKGKSFVSCATGRMSD